MKSEIRINPSRLYRRLFEMSQVGKLPGGGVSRLALTDADQAARDLFVSWMKEMPLSVQIDQVGNVIGYMPSRGNNALILIGSHLDTVNEAGYLDGALGVLAGLEVLQTLIENDIQTNRPIGVIAFTNEEGARFTTDMLGSRVFCGELSVLDAWNVCDFNGIRVGDELKRIRYMGDLPCGEIKPYAYLELHIEQGPILDREKITIGAVETITGISWQEVRVRGTANHAGTTPMDSRRDAGLAAAKIMLYLRELALSLPNQRTTCGRLNFLPGAINVIPSEALLTVDLRNGDDEILREAENRLSEYLLLIANQEGVEISTRILARVSPSICNPSVIGQIESIAEELGYPCRRMISGAGHDAQIMAHVCPTGMIFIPSKDGISHNPAEYSRLEDIEAGANVLLYTALRLAESR